MDCEGQRSLPNALPCRVLVMVTLNQKRLSHIAGGLRGSKVSFDYCREMLCSGKRLASFRRALRSVVLKTLGQKMLLHKADGLRGAKISFDYCRLMPCSEKRLQCLAKLASPRTE
jgi:hypothetical protein